MSTQYRITYGEYNNWVLPLNLAVGFHLVLAISILVLPDLLKPRPKFEDIYTVNLVNIAEPVVQQSIPEPVPEPVAQPEPEVSPEAIAIPDKVQQPPPQPKAVNPVSLKPSKRKIKKKLKDPKLERQKELESIKRQRLAEAVKAEQLAAEQARIAAEEAERQQRLMEQQLNKIRNQVKTTPAPQRSSGGQTGASELSALETQYISSIRGRIMQYWSLPEHKQFDDSTQALYIIKVSRDGTIIKQFFEQYSDDATFNQFVKKTVQDATPLPPMPPALKGNDYEFGLRFRPGNIL